MQLHKDIGYFIRFISIGKGITLLIHYLIGGV